MRVGRASGGSEMSLGISIISNFLRAMSIKAFTKEGGHLGNTHPKRVT